MPDHRSSVLIVDDSADGREMLGEYLKLRGFAVLEAFDGEMALVEARTRRPAVILMDLQMPGLDGWEATRRLKADTATRDIIVVALTAHAMMPDETIARRAGCDGFVSKPYDIIALGDAVDALLQRGRDGLDRLELLKQPATVTRSAVADT
jgi:two-component system cell cycle response regulator DivK